MLVQKRKPYHTSEKELPTPTSFWMPADYQGCVMSPLPGWESSPSQLERLSSVLGSDLKHSFFSPWEIKALSNFLYQNYLICFPLPFGIDLKVVLQICYFLFVVVVVTFLSTFQGYQLGNKDKKKSLKCGVLGGEWGLSENNGSINNLGSVWLVILSHRVLTERTDLMTVSQNWVAVQGRKWECYVNENNEYCCYVFISIATTGKWH